MQIHPVAVKPLKNYMLHITFSNGEVRRFDVKPYLSMPFFAPLKDETAFQRVFVNGITVEWQNGRDIAPHELYDNALPEPPSIS